MKYKLAAFSLITLFFMVNFLLALPINSNQKLVFGASIKKDFNKIRTLDNQTDAINNISRAEDGIFANYEVLFSVELNDGDVFNIFLCLSCAVYNLNLAESELYNGNYTEAIGYANKAYSIAIGLLPVSLVKGFESLENKEFITYMLPIIIIIIIISSIIGAILIYYISKKYLSKRRDEKLLKKKIIIPKNES
ncbi:MAG: hypothetical protein ACTSR3_16185 [Candidatus Helarchaeota archaeon]